MRPWTIHTGDVRQVARTLEVESFDGILCDPPYGIRFMGARWDYDVPSVNVWSALLRVLRPGSNAMIFGGPKTFHRVAVGVEDAGFELVDTCMYLHAVGFPKSLDISKAIDKRREDDLSETYEVTAWIRSARDAVGLSNKDVDAHFGLNGMCGHWASTKAQPIVPAPEQWTRLVAFLGARPPKRISDLVKRINNRKGTVGEAWLDREVTDEATPWRAVNGLGFSTRDGLKRDEPKSEEGRRWKGRGTQLKPAYEPLIWAMKPLDGTFAQNALRHGVAGIDVDGSRIGEDVITTHNTQGVDKFDRMYGGSMIPRTGDTKHVGRFPSNVVLDEGAAEILDREVGARRSTLTGRALPGKHANPGHNGGASWFGGGDSAVYADEDTRPSRFFFTAKVSREEREAGCEEIEARGAKQRFGSVQDGRAGRAGGSMRETAGEYPRPSVHNDHTTLKPQSLIRYFAKMILPPPRKDGRPRRILVPFSGAGSEMIGCLQAGWDEVVGIERDPHYVEIAEARIKKGRIFERAAKSRR